MSTNFQPKILLSLSIIPIDNSVRIGKISSDSGLELKITTSGGAENGLSKCEFNFEGKLWQDEMDNEYVTTHDYLITSDLDKGDYAINFNCEDETGNIAEATTSFSLEIDKTAPIVVRAYYEKDELKLITNEDSICKYSLDNSKQCRFNFYNETYEQMSVGLSKIHSADWASKSVYYIKCEDAWDNKNSNCAIRLINSTKITNGNPPLRMR